jgi:hypothetical protein
VTVIGVTDHSSVDIASDCHVTLAHDDRILQAHNSSLICDDNHNHAAGITGHLLQLPSLFIARYDITLLCTLYRLRVQLFKSLEYCQAQPMPILK